MGQDAGQGIHQLELASFRNLPARAPARATLAPKGELEPVEVVSGILHSAPFSTYQLLTGHTCDNGPMPTGAVSLPPPMLAARLRDLRTKAGLTQWEVATMLNTQANRVSDWETGRYEPSLPVLKRFAEVYEGEP